MRKFLRKASYYLYSIYELLTGFEDPLLIVRIFLNAAPQGVKLVRLRQTKLQFAVRSAMDVWSIKETFLDRFYERFGVKLGSNWKVVDIGGGIGEFTLLAATASPKNKVLAFEPFPASYQLLLQNLQQNRVENVQASPVAIGAESGTLYLDISAAEPLQYQSRSELKNPSALEVPSLSLEEMFTQFNLSNCDLLKLDCEGAEYDILLHAPPAALKRVQRIVLEYHDHPASERHTALLNHLEQAGYQIRTQPNFVHEALGYLYAWRSEAGA